MALIPAFHDAERWSDFREELFSWEGTPYRHLQMAKGYGADCTLFLANVLLKTKILKRVEKPKYYPRDWYLNREHEHYNLLHDYFKDNFNRNNNDGFVWKFREGIGDLRGDVLLFAFRKDPENYHHSAVYLGENIIFHSSVNKAARKEELTDKLKKYCRAHYRLYVETK